MINQSIPRSEDEESLHQDGRLQSVAVMTESLRLDVSSMQRNIKSHNGTIHLLLERGVADRDERKVRTVAQSVYIYASLFFFFHIISYLIKIFLKYFGLY